MPTEPDNERRTSATTAAAIQAQLLLHQCHDLISERDYQGAAAADQQAIKLVPDQPDPYIALVEARVGMGSHQRAVEACSEAYRRSQSDDRYEILKGRACNRHKVGDRIGSINDLTEMIVLQPENAQCHMRRGITRGETGDYTGAISDFNKAAAITGLNADLHSLLAHTYSMQAFAELDENP